MAVAAAGIAAAATIGGGLLSNSASAKAARKSIAFQREMAQNAHQYEVEDLRKAGLNPILSAMGRGASASGGAMPTFRNPAEGLAATALSAKRMKEEIANMKVTNNLIRQQTQATVAQGNKAYYEAETIKNMLPAAKAEGEFWKQDVDNDGVMKWLEKLGINANTAKMFLKR